MNNGVANKLQYMVKLGYMYVCRVWCRMVIIPSLIVFRVDREKMRYTFSVCLRETVLFQWSWWWCYWY